MVDERAIVNAMAALLATGGSTNHLIHWVAVARAAGIAIDWNDFAELSAVVPLLSRASIPTAAADVNQFQAAGGPGYVIRELLDAGLMHEDVLTVREGGHPRVHARAAPRPARRLALADIGAVARRPTSCARRPIPSAPPAASSCSPATWAAA